ncbi:MAG TPA: hypothetical protein VIQ78_00035 [Terrimesophilobacter sp.]|uniref:hypothetical protein n=1 Tax=Terrimesophilobacter sp. TaxID=2906435 RepID=UPI002F952C26
MTEATVAARRWPAALAGGLRVALAMLSEFFDHVVAEPYREGRLRGAAWPLGLRPIVVIAITGYGLAVAGILFSSALRESLALSVTVGSVSLSFPRPVLWVVLFLVVLAIALLQTAALHVSWWLASAVTALTVLVMVFAGALDNGSLLSPGRVATLVGGLALIVFTLVRRRRAFRWWEFPVVLIVVGLTFAIATGQAAAQSAPSGIDFGPSVLSLVMSSIGQLAIPAAIAAGAAVAELSCSTALWAVGVVQRRLPAAALLIGLGVLVAWRIWVLAAAFLEREGGSPLQLLTSVLLIAAIAGVWFLQSRLRGGGPPPSAAQLGEKLGSVATPIAAGLAATLAPIVVALLLLQVLFAYGVPLESVVWLQGAVGVLSTSTAVAIVRLAVGVALVVMSFLWAYKGRRTGPELIGGIGVVTATVAVAGLVGAGSWLWTSEGLTAVATLACFGLLAWYAARRQLTMPRVAGLAVALLLAAFFDQRDFVSDPLGALLGFTGVAFVLFGFVWAFLTSGGYANEGSPKFPQPARVLLLLANSVFGVTVLAFTALARDPNASINLGVFAGVGDQVFGTGLLAGALLAVLSSVVVGRMPWVPAAGDSARQPD